MKIHVPVLLSLLWTTSPPNPRLPLAWHKQRSVNRLCAVYSLERISLNTFKQKEKNTVKESEAKWEDVSVCVFVCGIGEGP